MIAGTAPAASVAAQPEWMLMGRHGGCVSLLDAADRHEIFGGVATPDRLIEKFRYADPEVLINDRLVGDARIVEVASARLGIAVVVVPGRLCP